MGLSPQGFRGFSVLVTHESARNLKEEFLKHTLYCCGAAEERGIGARWLGLPYYISTPTFENGSNI